MTVLVWVAAAFAGVGERTAVQDPEAAYGRLTDDSTEAREPAAWREVGEALSARKTSGSARSSEDVAGALYRAGLCFEKAFALSDRPEDRAKAASTYDEVSTRFRQASVADDALLRAGRLLETQGRLDESRSRYERIVREHPEGDVVSLARRRLQEVGKPSEISGIRSWSGPGYTRIVVDFSGSGVYSAGVLRENPAAGKPFRVFLDFKESRLAPDCTGCLAVGDSLLKQVRSARFDARTVRIVMDLEGPASFRVFRLDAPSRVVLDLFRTPGEKPPVSVTSRNRSPGEGEGAANGRPSGRPRIVIDPGHGGADPGAIGPDGTKEKDVVLAIAKELGEKLRSRFPCEIRFTRDRDRTVPLEERTAIANAFGADLFVSIHANASRSPSARGTETYYLERASDRSSRAVAARENASGDEGVSEIEHILADVLLSSKVGESRRLAEVLHETLVAGLRADYAEVRDLGVKRAPFYVLTGAAMPAVLVETAFISHSQEVRRLGDPQYRARTAEALVAGLAKFVNGTTAVARKKQL